MTDSLPGVWRRLRDWAVERAFPLWATAGFDRDQGRFAERLTLDGERFPEAPVRLVVQARQIYCFSVAGLQGWHAGARELAKRAFASLRRDYLEPDGRPGGVFSILSDGTVVDSRRDLYAHAFVLLAVGAYVRATGDRTALELADQVLGFIDGHMRAPRAGGYLDALPSADETRRQNPHMHLFEGFLALWQASGERGYLDRAAEMFDLFTSCFFQPGTGVLLEYFDQALCAAPGTAGRIVEPGHHYEWIWLLRWFARETGRSVQDHADALYAHADRHGYDAAGLIVDEVLIDGAVLTPSRRLWPVTEAIKANLAEASLGRSGAEEKAARLAGMLVDRFLLPSGGWIDRLDAHGAAATDYMPASSLYHIVCALGELDRFVAGRGA